MILYLELKKTEESKMEEWPQETMNQKRLSVTKEMVEVFLINKSKSNLKYTN